MNMRIKVIKIIYFVLMSMVVVRLGYWQVISSDRLTAMAEGQRITKKELGATRGDILFSDGSVLASTQPTFTIYAQPKLINEKKEEIAYKVAEVFAEEDGKTEVKKLSTELGEALNKNLFWVSLGNKVPITVKEKIEKLKLMGVGFEPSTSRFYPEGSSSAHLLGFVGSDVYGKETGYFGLEGFYNGELRGKNGSLTVERDALGVPILMGDFISKESKEGKTLILSIDRSVQYMVEEKIKKGVEKYQAKEGSVVIMEPRTGNIIAMASYPSYDPSKLGQIKSESYRNPIIADGYEPGSTFKVLVMAAAISDGAVELDTKCDICETPIKIGGFIIRTWNNRYKKDSTMTDVIVHSDNIGMVFVGKKLGLPKLYSYIRNFGFGDVTGIDLQDEYSPSLRDENEWREIDIATATFGQGISVTALQIARAVSAIANGGRLMEPHVVSEIHDGSSVIKIKPKVVANPINQETAKTITWMMVKAVDEGESKFAKPKGYKIAGKTGTAQIPIAGHYDSDKTIASFVGFAPPDNPKFVMLVRYKEPTSSTFGSETAAPTFFEIARELFIYYGIPPEANI